MKNYISATFGLMVLIVSGLVAMQQLPVIRIGKFTMRKVDLLSDIRPRPKVHWVDSDTVAPPIIKKPVFVDTCQTGMTCIEDYADSTGFGMAHFYESLSQSSHAKRAVRIAYLGDSFIEGDILTGYLREFMQQKYGGKGVGYVSITTPTAGFRPTVVHQYNGWSSHAITDTCCFVRARQDLANRYFMAHSGAWVQLKGTKRTYSTVDTASVSHFYLVAADTVEVTARWNGKEEKNFTLYPDSTLQTCTIEDPIGSIRWTVSHASAKSTFYGCSMETETGVIVDNFSLRGSSGQQLKSIPLRTLKQWNKVRPYDLIVLHYGPNIASPRVRNYSYYTRQMQLVIDHLKTAFPQTSILLIGASDRAYKNELGELVTMPGIVPLIRYQQALAADTHVAFWNLYQAMGGEGSIVRMVEAHPAAANLDYTHINFRGGKQLARLLFDVWVYGQTQYEKKKAYE